MLLILTDLVTTSPPLNVFFVFELNALEATDPRLLICIYSGGGGGGDTRQHFIFAHRDSTP